jgi:hypothetical protein
MFFLYMGIGEVLWNGLSAYIASGLDGIEWRWFHTAKHGRHDTKDMM